MLDSSTGFALLLLKMKRLCTKCCAFNIWTDVEWLILSDSDRQSPIFGQLAELSLLLPPPPDGLPEGDDKFERPVSLVGVFFPITQLCNVVF